MTFVLRIGLAVTAAVMAIVGAWNQFWPEHFFTYFPTVSLLPPYSEHYARDFGGASLGIGVVLACAAAYMTELHHGTPADEAFNIVATGGAALLPPALLVVAVLRMRRDRRALHDPAVG